MQASILEASTSRAGRARRGSPALWIAVVLYLAFRALVLHTNFDAVAIPVFELPVMGNLATLGSTSESGAPFVRYYDNCGGQMLTGLLAVPLYALLGDTYLTLKLVPLGLGLATLLVVWRLLARHYDRRAADLFALLFVLGPPTLAKYSLLAKGNHFENLVFQAGVLALFLRLHQRGTTRAGLFATAVAAGFALFVYFGTVVLLVTLAVVHFAVRGRRALADAPVALMGVALGLAPLLWIQRAGGGRPEGFLRSKLHDVPAGGLEGLVQRVGAFCTDVLPRAGAFEDLGPVPARAAEVGFLTLFACAWLVLAASLVRELRALRRRPEPMEPFERERARLAAWKTLPFLAWLPVFVLTVSLARFDFDPYGAPVEVGGFRYLVPHFFIALVVIALAVAELRRGTRVRRVASVALAGGALCTGAFTLPIVDWSAEHTGNGPRYPGHDFLQYANVVLREREMLDGVVVWDVARVADELVGLSPAHRRDAWIGVGHYAAWAQRLRAEREPVPSAPSLARLLAPYPSDVHVELARGAGSFLRCAAVEHRDRERLANELGALRDEAHPLLPALVEGLCLDLRYPLVRRGPTLLAESAALGGVVPLELRPNWRRGQGVQAGRIAARGLAPDHELARRLFSVLPPAAADDFWLGFGRGLAEGAEDGALPACFDELVPAEQRERAMQGVLLAVGAARVRE